MTDTKVKIRYAFGNPNGEFHTIIPKDLQLITGSSDPEWAIMAYDVGEKRERLFSLNRITLWQEYTKQMEESETRWDRIQALMSRLSDQPKADVPIEASDEDRN